jgi:hypothetical protein
MCAGIVSKPRIVPEWCFIDLIQNIKQSKAVFLQFGRLQSTINGLKTCLKLKYERYIILPIM